MDVVFKKDEQGKNDILTRCKNKILSILKDRGSNFYFFLILCALGFIFFASSLLENQFTTLFGGDYTAQQLSFYTNGYDDWWHFFKTGQFVLYDTNTYLGVSNVGANSFYYLFDPFFLPILLCPREFIAQGMVVLTVLKIATAGMVFMHYMKVMGASKNASRLSAMAYAFSGWMAWFLWFNHMTEIMIVFPVMLLGVERVLRDKKPWVLMVGLFLMGITNYFFLIGMTIAAFFYAMFRYFQRLRLNTTKDNLIILGVGFIGFLTGLLLACVVVIPAALYSLDAPRAANSSYADMLKTAISGKDYKKLIGLIFSWKVADKSEFRHLYPLISFVFPSATCRGTPLAIYGDEWYDNTATNIYSFVPMLLMFVPAFIRAMKNKKWSAIVAVSLFVLALEIPFTYYMFFGFTAAYGRWELFFITSYITFTGLHLDHFKEDPVWEDIASFVFAIVLIVAGGIFGQTLIDKYTNFTQRSSYIDATGATFVMILYTSVVFVIILFLKKNKNIFNILMALVGIEAAVMGYLTIEGHWCGSFIEANNGLVYNNAIYSLNKKIEKNDKSYYRVWTYNQNEGARNDGMRNDYNGLGCFHSLYNFNINNFANWTRIQDYDPFYGSGCWAGSYVWKNSDIDRFLGVKYYFMQKNSVQWGWMYDYKQENKDEADKENPFQYNVPLGYEIRENYQNNEFVAFENVNHTNFAFGFEKVYTYKTKDNSVQSESVYMPTSSSVSVLRNDELLLEAALMDEETGNRIVAKNPTLLKEETISNRELKKQNLDNIKSELYDLNVASDSNQYTVNTFFENNAMNWYQKHALTSADLVNVDGGKFAKVNFPEPGNEDVGRYVNVVKPNTGTTFDDVYDPEGYAIYVPYYYDKDYAADIYLISEDNTIITWDRHQDDKYEEGWYKYRGFYVHKRNCVNPDGTITVKDAPKLAKIIVANRKAQCISNSELKYGIRYEKYSDQLARTSNLDDYEVTDVKYSTNTFKFKTNFAKNIVVVTQLPYEKGFTVKAKGTDGKTKTLETFSAQGGFVSFVSEIGDTSYTLSFYPDKLNLGLGLSLAGALLCGGTIFTYIYLGKKINKKEEIVETPVE